MTDTHKDAKDTVVRISGMNETPAGDRTVIGFFGRRNVGKSSVVNAVTGQQLAIVSDVKGTTTDPVQKAMELLPLGPVLIIDTPGIDDSGSLGEKRVTQTRKVLNKTDIAVLIADATEGMTLADEELVEIFKAKATPYVIAFNKADLTARESAKADPCSKGSSRMTSPAAKSSSISVSETNPASASPAAKSSSISVSETNSASAFPAAKPARISISVTESAPKSFADKFIMVSATTGEGIAELKELIAGAARPEHAERRLVGDLISEGDFVILVVPIDSAAPKGRLILPQQQVIRDVLESGAAAVVVRESELGNTLKSLGKKPRLVITDSQVFEQVSDATPPDIPLTSFSILFARHKGDLGQSIKGAAALDKIKDGDKILICEGCTHHRQCDDIGTVKLPRWISDYSKSKPDFEFTSGGDFPIELSGYKLIVHCGACMLNEREVRHRLAMAGKGGAPITNYGILIAKIHGILDRSIEVFTEELFMI